MKTKEDGDEHARYFRSAIAPDDIYQAFDDCHNHAMLVLRRFSAWLGNRDLRALLDADPDFQTAAAVLMKLEEAKHKKLNMKVFRDRASDDD